MNKITFAENIFNFYRKYYPEDKMLYFKKYQDLLNFEEKLKEVLFKKEVSENGKFSFEIFKLKRRILKDLFLSLQYLGLAFLKYNKKKEIFLGDKNDQKRKNPNEEDIFMFRDHEVIKNGIDKFDNKEILKINQGFFIGLLDSEKGNFSEKQNSVKDFLKEILDILINWRNFIKENSTFFSEADLIQKFEEKDLKIIDLLFLISLSPKLINSFYFNNFKNNFLNLSSNFDYEKKDKIELKEKLEELRKIPNYYRIKFFEFQKEKNIKPLNEELPFFNTLEKANNLKLIKEFEEKIQILNPGQYYDDLSDDQINEYLTNMIKMNNINHGLLFVLSNLKFFYLDKEKKDKEKSDDEKTKFKLNDDFEWREIPKELNDLFKFLENFINGYRHHYFYFSDKKLDLKENNFKNLYKKFLETLEQIYDFFHKLKVNNWPQIKDNKNWNKYLLLGFRQSKNEEERIKKLESIQNISKPKKKKEKIIIFRETILFLLKKYILNYKEQYKKMARVKINLKWEKEDLKNFNTLITKKSKSKYYYDKQKIIENLENFKEKRNLKTDESKLITQYIEWLNRKEKISDINDFLDSGFKIVKKKELVFSFKKCLPKKKYLQLSFFNFKIDNLKDNFWKHRRDFENIFQNLQLDDLDIKRSEKFKKIKDVIEKSYKSRNIPLKFHFNKTTKKAWQIVILKIIDYYENKEKNIEEFDKLIQSFLEIKIKSKKQGQEIKYNENFFFLFIPNFFKIEKIKLFPNKNLKESFINQKEILRSFNLSTDFNVYKKYSNNSNILDYKETLKMIRDDFFKKNHPEAYFANEQDYLRDFIENKQKSWTKRKIFDDLDTDCLNEEEKLNMIKQNLCNELKRLNFAMKGIESAKNLKEIISLFDKEKNDGYFFKKGGYQLKLDYANKSYLQREFKFIYERNYRFSVIAKKGNDLSEEELIYAFFTDSNILESSKYQDKILKIDDEELKKKLEAVKNKIIEKKFHRDVSVEYPEEYLEKILQIFK